MPEAYIGIVGVVIGVILTYVAEWWRSARDTQKNARYLAVRMVCILDEFVNMCAAKTGDELDDELRYSDPAPQPELASFPEDLDWTSIDHQLAYAILNLPNRINYTRKSLIFISNYAHEDGLLEEVHYKYSILGLLGADITEQLRKKYDIPAQLQNPNYPDWNPHKSLLETKEAIERARKKR
jgi:hypothetical protein